MALKSKKTGRFSNSVIRQVVQYVRYGERYGWPCNVYTHKKKWPNTARVDASVLTKGLRYVDFYGEKGRTEVSFMSNTPRTEIKRIVRECLKKVGRYEDQSQD